MNAIEPTELAETIHDGNADSEPLVVDIRPGNEFDEWHIPGSENIDVYDELKNDHEAAIDGLATLPDDREIVTVCGAGKLAATASDLLVDRGYEAKTLIDGMRGWSRVHRSATVEAEIDGTLIQVSRPGKGCLSYILIADGEAAVFDPSHYLDVYDSILDEQGATVVGVYDTHAHADHLSGGRSLADRHDVPYYLHGDDARSIGATPLSDGDAHTIGSVPVTVIHTPGHSPGGVTYSIDDAALLTGDTLFHESVGRVELGVEAGLEETDVEENAATLYESLRRLREIPGDPLVLPAHDPGSPEPPIVATVSEIEQQNEDFVRDRDNFIETIVGDIPDHPPNFKRIKGINSGDDLDPDEDLSRLELGPNRCAAK